MKKELDLPLDRFSGSDGWQDRIESIDAFKYLSSAEKMIYCLREGMDVYQAMIKCNVSFGAMNSFHNVYYGFKTVIEKENEQKAKLNEIHYDFNQETGECRPYRLDSKGNKIYIEGD